MCCIIYRPRDTQKIDQTNLEKIIAKNYHGWGISYINDEGELFVEKSMDMDKAIAAIRVAEESNREFIFHARWATHGEKNEQNCHPFEVHDGVMFHNGKMEAGGWDLKMSDSWHFSHKLIKFCGRKGRKLDELINKKFKHIVGSSRLAFMMKDGTIHRYGEWHEIDGCFYSKIDWKNYYVKSSGATAAYPYDDDYYYEMFGHSYGGAKYESRSKYKLMLESILDESDKESKESFKDELDRGDTLERICNCISAGVVKDVYIDVLRLEDVTFLCDEYPLTMAKFLYDEVNKKGA